MILGLIDFFYLNPIIQNPPN